MIIGLDFSLRKIGVATGQLITQTATPLTTIINKIKGQPYWKELDPIISQWKPDILVVGLPLNMDGSTQDTTERAQQFGQQIQKRYNISVEYIDERLSSREASHILGYEGNTSPRRNSKPGKKLKKSKRQAGDIDSVAAQLILQSWLHENCT